MLTGWRTTVVCPAASRVVTTAVAWTVRPRANRLRAAWAILTLTFFFLPAATWNEAWPMVRQPRAQRAARARPRLGGAAPATWRAIVPRQALAAPAGQPSAKGTAEAAAGSVIVGGKVTCTAGGPAAAGASPATSPSSPGAAAASVGASVGSGPGAAPGAAGATRAVSISIEAADTRVGPGPNSRVSSMLSCRSPGTVPSSGRSAEVYQPDLVPAGRISVRSGSNPEYIVTLSVDGAPTSAYTARRAAVGLSPAGMLGAATRTRPLQMPAMSV